MRRIRYNWSYHWIQFVIIYCPPFSRHRRYKLWFIFYHHCAVDFGQSTWPPLGSSFPVSCVFYSELSWVTCMTARLSSVCAAESLFFIIVEQWTFLVPPSWLTVCPTELGVGIQPF